MGQRGGFVVVKRVHDWKGREKFFTVSRRYHVRDSAQALVALFNAKATRGDVYYVRDLAAPER